MVDDYAQTLEEVNCYQRFVGAIIIRAMKDYEKGVKYEIPALVEETNDFVYESPKLLSLYSAILNMSEDALVRLLERVMNRIDGKQYDEPKKMIKYKQKRFKKGLDIY